MLVDVSLEKKMKTEDLVGTRVWMKSDQFRRVAGIMSSVPQPVELGDLESSVEKSIFKVELTSGEVIQVEGSDIDKIDHERSAVPKVSP